MMRSTFCIIIVLLILHRVNGQAIDTDFGKNRVQFHDDFEYWSKYETQHFILYWYGKGRNVGEIAAQIAEMDHDEIRKIIEHKINDKIEIIVYVDVNDLKQSNIGAEDAFISESGQTKIVGNKMFVYFDGNHQHLRQRIREGIASVYFNAMIFGANFQEVIQNAVLLEVPDWYAKGLTSYAGSPWNIYIEDELRDIINQKETFKNWEKLNNRHPRVAGHALWYYISQQYGKSAIANLLYLTRISRDVENAFEFVLNTSLKQVFKECERYYLARFEEEKGMFNLHPSNARLPLRHKLDIPVSAMLLSPDGRYLAYATNQIGKVKLYIRDTQQGKVKKIFSSGFKNNFQETDYDFPALAWSPDSDELTFTSLCRDEMYIHKYNIKSGERAKQLLPEIIQRVYSLAYYDSRYYILSASTDGQSDLFQYDAKDRTLLEITKDDFDDLDVSVTTIDDQKGILFSSNRYEDHVIPQDIDTILPIENFDIFFYPYGLAKDDFELRRTSKIANRLTTTSGINERFPAKTTQGIVATSDQHGIVNAITIDNDGAHTVTNQGRNIIRHTVAKDGSKYAMTYYQNGGYETHIVDGKDLVPMKAYSTAYSLAMLKSNDENIDSAPPKEEDKYDKGMSFASEFQDPPNLTPLRDGQTQNILPIVMNPSSSLESINQTKTITIDPLQITAAGLRFKLANVTTRMDNEVLFEGLELYDGQNPQVNQLPMGFLLKATVNDLFEDYSFEGGARFPTTFNGSEYFMFFDNKKNLIDKRFGLYRRTLTEGGTLNLAPFTRAKKEAIVSMVQWKYPLDIYQSVRATASLRWDRAYYKSTNDFTFNAPINRDQRLGIKIEYIFDNTLDHYTNIKHGTRAKVYAEGYNLFKLNVIDGFDFKATDGLTGVIGFDARHYIPILNWSVLAFRGAGATSFGSLRNVYMIGDVNNTILPSFDNAIPLPEEAAFAFKSNVNHVRGFKSNIRNGSSFLLANAELRVSFMRYILGKYKGISFFRNMQLVGFTDAGLAWYGASPYASGNPLNTVFIDGPVAQIEVKYYRDPIVIGYGFGMRTTVLGYFLRLDYARGIETRQLQAPRLHVSFGFDF